MSFRHISLQLFGLDRSPFFGRHIRTASCSCFVCISPCQNLMMALAMASFAPSDSAFITLARILDSPVPFTLGHPKNCFRHILFLHLLLIPFLFCQMKLITSDQCPDTPNQCPNTSDQLPNTSNQIPILPKWPKSRNSRSCCFGDARWPERNPGSKYSSLNVKF